MFCCFSYSAHNTASSETERILSTVDNKTFGKHDFYLIELLVSRGSVLLHWCCVATLYTCDIVLHKSEVPHFTVCCIQTTHSWLQLNMVPTRYSIVVLRCELWNLELGPDIPRGLRHNTVGEQNAFFLSFLCVVSLHMVYSCWNVKFNPCPDWQY